MNAAYGVALVADFEDGRRTLRVVDDPEWMALGEREELCGREIDVLADGTVAWA